MRSLSIVTMEEQGASSIDPRFLTGDMETLIREHKRDLIICLRIFDLLMGDTTFKDVISVQDEQHIMSLDSEGKFMEAAEKFLNALLKSQEPRKWRVFTEALNHPEHCFVKSILFDPASDDSSEELNHCCQILDIFRPHILGVSAEELREHLREKEMITESDAQRIAAVNLLQGESRAIYMTLNMLPKSKDWFREFCKILFKMGHQEVVKLLDESVYEKLLSQDTYDSCYGEERCSEKYTSGSAALSSGGKLMADNNNTDELMDSGHKFHSTDKIINVSGSMNIPAASLNDLSEGPVSSRTRSKTALMASSFSNPVMVNDGNGGRRSKNISGSRHHHQPHEKYQRPLATRPPKEADVDSGPSSPIEGDTAEGSFGFQSPMIAAYMSKVSKDEAKAKRLGFQRSSHIPDMDSNLSPSTTVKERSEDKTMKKMTKSKSENAVICEQAQHVDTKPPSQLKKAKSVPTGREEIEDTQERWRPESPDCSEDDGEAERGNLELLFHCPDCSTKCLSEKNLVEHKKICSRKSTPVGSTCQNEDYRSKDRRISLFPCPNCDSRFMSQQKLEKHRCRKLQINAQSCLNQRPEAKRPTVFCCPSCPAKLLSQEKLDEHRRNNCGKGPVLEQTMSLDGQICKRKFDSEKDLKIHMGKLHPPNAGGTCAQRVPEADKLVHKQEHFTCQVCKRQLDSVKGMKIHMTKTHTPNANGAFAPMIPEARKGVEEEKHFRCRICKGQFSTEKGLKIHMTKMHLLDASGTCAKMVPEYDKPLKKDEYFTCQICKKQFSTEKGLKIHTTKMHSNNK